MCYYYCVVMSSTVTPEAERLADELVKRLGERPLSPRKLAVELAGQDASPALIGAFDAALSRTAATGETDSLDEALWGQAPTDEELAQARHVTYPTL